MYLTDLFAEVELGAAIVDGYVRARPHPTHPLVILNYAEKAVYERAWTAVTRNCRGLIYDTRTGEVVARPWPKFHNWGEHDQDRALDLPQLDLDAPVEVTDKLDGSLGILVRGYGEPFLATRGSFISEQAKWATAWFRRYADVGAFDPAKTYLFEILAAWNRVVVQYDWEGLVLLGIVDTESGRCDPLPDDPRALQARAPRDDAGEHGDGPRGAVLPGVPLGGTAAGHGASPRAASGVPQAVGEGERGEAAGLPPACPAGDPSGAASGERGEAVPRLRRDVPADLHGLRPREGDEGVQRGPGQDARPARGGAGEVRAGLRQLPPHPDGLAFRIVDRFPAASLRDALALPPRQNAEGVVVRFVEDDLLVKIKQDDYVALHRIVTGLNARVVWEAVGPGGIGLEALVAPLPDELHDWARYVAGDLLTKADAELAAARATYDALVASLPDGFDRKAFAEAAVRDPLRALLFMLLDGRDPLPVVWRNLRPSGTETPREYGEDVA